MPEVEYGDTLVVCETGLAATLSDPGETTIDYLVDAGCVYGTVIDTGSARLIINLSPSLFNELEASVYGSEAQGLDRGVMQGDVFLFRLER